MSVDIDRIGDAQAVDAMALTKSGDAQAVDAMGRTVSGNAEASDFSLVNLYGDAFAVNEYDLDISGDAFAVVGIFDLNLSGDCYARRPPLAPAQQNLLSKWKEEQREALLPKPCATCAPVDCIDGGDVNYSLEGASFPLVPVCPPGVNCNFGLQNPIPGGERFIIECCEGTIYRLYFGPGTGPARRKQTIAYFMYLCSLKLPFCTGGGSDCPNPPCEPPCLTPPCIIYGNNFQTCSEKCADGSSFKATIAAGTYFAFSQIAADQGAYKQACGLARDHKICLLGLEAVTCVNAPYSDDFVATGRYVAAYPNSDTISIIDGALPNGIELNGGGSFITGGRCKLEGTPTVAGIYTFTIQIVLGTFGSPGYGDRQTRTYTLKVCAINPDTLPDAKIGVKYDQTLTVTPDHDDETETWTLLTSLPAGLTLDPEGFIRGTPTGPSESHNVTVKCCFTLDDEPVCCTKQYTLTVNPNTVTPDIFSSAQSCWGTYPAGTYRVSYVNGALNYSNDTSLWQVGNLIYTRYNIRHDNGSTNTGFSELTQGTYASQALAEAANAGKTHDIIHTGGTICMWFDDAPYTDNHSGSPNPTFLLTKIS